MESFNSEEACLGMDYKCSGTNMQLCVKKKEKENSNNNNNNNKTKTGKNSVVEK